MLNVRTLDQAGLRTGQVTTIVLLLAAFIVGRSAWPLVAFVGIAQLMGAFALPAAPYRLFYQFLRQAKVLQPNPQPDNPEPHRFAMGIGAAFNLSAAIALLSGATMLAWVLVWIVILLANLNYWGRFCVGCWMYYQLNRLGVPGFTAAPIENTQP